MIGPSDHILERLKVLHPKHIDLTLDRVWRLLGDLGDPHLRLPPVIHVAGTNGKGSVCATLRAILEAAGQRVHVYTSPHLVRFNERIRLDGRLIDESALGALLDEVETRNAGRPITFFEVTTAAAFLAFARAPADWLVLEVGLGGRLDATNVVARPAATVVTPVSLDHQHFLGDTVAAIAGEKAGILKPGVIGVIGPQVPEAAAVIAARAAAVGAQLAWWGRDFRAEAGPAGLVYRDGATTLELPLPALPGAHQVDNTAIAMATALRLPTPPSREAIATGIAATAWPARLQRLAHGRLANLLPPGWELWLDGGHNPAGGAVLARQAVVWRDRPLDLVVGMINSKDIRGFLEPLAPFARRVVCVTIRGEANAVPAATLVEAAIASGMRATAATDTAAALATLAGGAGPARALICGSLYFAGTVLADDAPEGTGPVT